MKHMKRSNTYKNSTGTLTFDPETGTGRSYNWYKIAERFNNVQVVNSYNYSATTIKHAGATRALMHSLNVDYIQIEAPNGLQDLDSSVELYKGRIQELIKLIKNPRSRVATNKRRLEQIKRYKSKMNLVKLLINNL